MGMGMNIYIDFCFGVFVDMCRDICMDMCLAMFRPSCIEICVDMHGHAYECGARKYL